MRVRTRVLLVLLSGAVLLGTTAAHARGGNGEDYDRRGSSSKPQGGSSPRSSGQERSKDDGDHDLAFAVFEELVIFAFREPQLGFPLLLVAGVGYALYRVRWSPRATTLTAFRQREDEVRTQVSSADVRGWVNALKLHDPELELQPLMEKFRETFTQVQAAWLARDLSSVRPLLSDAAYERFRLQLALRDAQGVRDAFTDLVILDATPIGLEQSAWFDTLHVRFKAELRDGEVRASATEDELRAAARAAKKESFIEVWSFVRKPGTKTRAGDVKGKCPSCGAPFSAEGTSSNCEFCKAVVNSGSFDWVLTEITQGSEVTRGAPMVDNLLEARTVDPALNLEMLEDRTSLIFWKWIEARTVGDVKTLAKLATAPAQSVIANQLSAVTDKQQRRVYLECAVGAVKTRVFRIDPEGFDEAHVEVRFSARSGTVAAGAPTPSFPKVPQRFMFVLTRKHGAQTQTDTGLSTNRCAACHATLTETFTPGCDYCGATLASGEQDWVLARALPIESWNSDENRRLAPRPALQRPPAAEAVITDPAERERLLFMMAALAMSDGVVEARERRLLKLCADRWGVAWSQVELALQSGPELFDRLLPKGSTEAESFLQSLVQMAWVDGKIDRKERQMLEQAAYRLGLSESLPRFLERA